MEFLRLCNSTSKHRKEELDKVMKTKRLHLQQQKEEDQLAYISCNVRHPANKKPIVLKGRKSIYISLRYKIVNHRIGVCWSVSQILLVVRVVIIFSEIVINNHFQLLETKN